MKSRKLYFYNLIDWFSLYIKTAIDWPVNVSTFTWRCALVQKLTLNIASRFSVLIVGQRSEISNQNCKCSGAKVKFFEFTLRLNAIPNKVTMFAWPFILDLLCSLISFDKRSETGANSEKFQGGLENTQVLNPY